MITGSKNCIRLAWLAALLGMASAWSAPGHSRYEQHEVMAVFLFRFAHFINWPSTSFERSTSPFRYCVFDSNPITRTLAEVIEGEYSGDHPLELTRISGSQDLDGCHVLFLSRDDRLKVPAVLQSLNSSNVLTVTDTEGFLSDGAMIALGSTGPRLRPIINVAAISQAGLKVNAKLMSIATPWDG